MCESGGGAQWHLHGSLNRGGPSVLGQQAGVDVEGAKAGNGQELLWEDVPVGCCDAQVRPDGLQLFKEGLLCHEICHLHQGALLDSTIPSCR